MLTLLHCKTYCSRSEFIPYFSIMCFLCFLLYAIIVLCVTSKDINTLTQMNSSDICQKRDFGFGYIICVCNSTFCDVINEPQKITAPSFLVYTSDKAGSRFKKTQGHFMPSINNISNAIYVDSNKKFQKVLGFGGALTDSTGINIKGLSEGAQRKLMRSYFGEEGIKYNFIRVPMGATDFSPRGYTYDDAELPDPDLVHFKLAPEDYNYKIPLIKEAIEITKNNVKIMACSWTSPNWMKTVSGYSIPFGEIRDNMYQSWADYHKKFLDAYKKNNITIWGISTGNEPIVGMTLTVIPNIAFTPQELSTWIADYFGPTIRNSEYSDIKIIALDEMRINLPAYLDVMAENPKTLSYIDAIAVHWYYDKYSPTSILQKIHRLYPNKFLLGTEACKGNGFENGILLGAWYRGEAYAVGIIENMRNWFVTWIDWNMVLDLKGGPSYVNVAADAPIIVNKYADEFYKQPMFYAMGHFSKFIPPGSFRIDVSQFDYQILSIAFQKPDGGVVVIIVNLYDLPVNISIVDKRRRQQANLVLTSHSISTVLYW